MSHYIYMHNDKQKEHPMNTQNTPPEERPLGYWLTATDRLLAAEFARAFENEGITRRDWRLLNAVDGTVPTGRPVDDRKLGRLIELGWIAPAESGWALTDDGRAAKERLGGVVDGIRTTVAEAVSPEEYATTIASLTAIARALGWDENAPLPRKHRGRDRDRDGHRRHGGYGHRHGHRFGRFGRFGEHAGHAGFAGDQAFDGEHDGYGRGHRFGEHDGRRFHERFDGPETGDHGRGHGFAPHPSDGRGPGHADHGYGRDRRHGEHPASDRFGQHGHGAPDDTGHGTPGERYGRRGPGGMHRRIARMAQRAYERGFDVGFERGSTVR